MCDSDPRGVTSSSSEIDEDSVASEDQEDGAENEVSSVVKESSEKELYRKLISLSLEMMRDVCVFIVFVLILSRFNNEAGYASKQLLKTIGLAEAEKSTVPEAAAPQGLPTKSYKLPWNTFFHKEKELYLDDYPTGNIYEAFAEADKHQNAFFMYYAPWDGDSNRATAIINEVAKIFHLAQNKMVKKELYIGAVNCWLPHSDCVKEFYGKNSEVKNGEKTFNKAAYQPFPIFVFYPKDRRGIQYNGALTATDILEFLISALNPVRHLVSMEDCTEMRIQHGGTLLVGYFPNLYQDRLSKRAYKQLLGVSYQMLEIDPSRSLFGGVGVVTKPDLAFQLHLNATAHPARMIFWNGTSVAFPRKTLRKSSDKLFAWVKGIMRNSNLLTQWVGSTGQKSLFLSDRLLRNNADSLIVFLQRTNKNSRSSLLNLLHETALLYSTCRNVNNSLQRHFHHQLLEIRKRAEVASLRSRCANQTIVLQAGRNGFHSFSHSDLDTHEAVTKAKMHFKSKLNVLRELRCDENAMQGYRFFTVSEAVEGLGCKDNKTLNFYTANLETQKQLAKSIGINISSDEAVAVIVSLKGEVVYTSDGLSLSEFIKQYHADHRRLKKVLLSKKLFRRSGNDKMSVSFIEEISSKNFHDVVMDPQMNVVLLYKTSFCAFCQAPTAHVFHSVFRIFNKTSSQTELNLRFVTVDAANNDLQWHFTALSTPTVLFFPAGKDRNKSDTRAFPSSKPMTVLNLLNFVLANLDAKTREIFLVSKYKSIRERKDVDTMTEGKSEL